MKHLIDAHCHIYPEKIARKAVDGINHFYDGLPGDHFDGTMDTLLQAADAEGVDHHIVFSVATTPHQVSSINQFIARSVAAADGRFTGLGTMHLDSDDYERDLNEAVELGLKGIKLHPDIQQFCVDDPRAMRIFGMLEDRGLPVYVHTGDFRYDNSNPNRVAKVLTAFPKLKFVGPHLGGWSVWDQVLGTLTEFDNIVVDTSSCSFLIDPELECKLIRAFGSERVMFGTDYPMWPVRQEVDALDELGLTEEECEDIYWRTCAKLFHLELD